MTEVQNQLKQVIEILSKDPSQPELKNAVSDLETLQVKIENIFQHRVSEEAEKITENYEKRLNRAKQIIFELEGELDIFRKEKTESEKYPSATLIQEEEETDTGFVEPPLSKLRYLEALIDSEIDDRLRTATSLNDISQGRIKRLEDELEYSQNEIKILKYACDIGMEEKVAHCERRIQELVAEKLELQEDLKTVSKVRSSLMEQIQKLSEESCLSKRTIKNLQDKVNGYKALNKDLEEDALRAIIRVRELELENENLSKKFVESKKHYEAKIKLMADAEKLAQVIAAREINTEIKQRRSSITKRSFQEESHTPNPFLAHKTSSPSDSGNNIENAKENATKNFMPEDYIFMDTINSLRESNLPVRTLKEEIAEDPNLSLPEESSAELLVTSQMMKKVAEERISEPSVTLTSKEQPRREETFEGAGSFNLSTIVEENSQIQRLSENTTGVDRNSLEQKPEEDEELAEARYRRDVLFGIQRDHNKELIARQKANQVNRKISDGRCDACPSCTLI